MMWILNSAQRLLNRRVARFPLWAWMIAAISCMMFNDIIGTFCAYGAMIFVTMSGIALMLTNRRWARRLFTYAIALAVVYALLVRV